MSHGFTCVGKYEVKKMRIEGSKQINCGSRYARRARPRGSSRKGLRICVPLGAAGASGLGPSEKEDENGETTLYAMQKS